MKKGFTLVELLAVIVILGILGLVVYPSVISVIKDARDSAYKSQVKVIEKASKEWGVEHPNNLPEIDSATSVWISVSKLIKDGYISNDDVANPKGDIKNMNGCVEVKYESNQYTYSYKPECPSLQK